jgi:preprotein translocase subunit SecA
VPVLFFNFHPAPESRVGSAAGELSAPLDRDPSPPVSPASRRLGSRATNLIQAKFGLPAARRLARAALLVPAIRFYEQKYGNLSDADLVARVNRLRGLARSGIVNEHVVAEAFGLCSIAIWRELGMLPFDVQLAAGVVMHEGGLVELATGEGKTLTAALPTVLNALTAKGVHVTTVNDYLARRDAEWMAPVYHRLGLTVGVLQMKSSPRSPSPNLHIVYGIEDAERAEAYRCDITYGTASEFGFDFLRDRLKVRGGQAAKAPFWAPWVADVGPVKLDPRVQRELHYAIVDEADSIFIDEARTPLIISAPTREATPEEQIVYRWADQVARGMTPHEHFFIDIKKEKIEMTESGRAVVRYSNPPGGPNSKAMDKLFEAIEKSLHAHFRFVRDHHYMVVKDKVVIVDESTGRPMPDRHWREGLHQAVEAKEGAPIHLAADHAAQITFQSYFRQYKKLAGMSGTVIQNARELRRVYKLRTVLVPTNRPVIRERWHDRVYPTEAAKFDAIVREVVAMQKQGRPVLIGTRSVEKSEALAQRLKKAGVEHQVLNAKQNEQEAMIVAQAGRPGAVTVATNMAGRGTDIKLGGALDEMEKAVRDDPNLSDDEKRHKIEELRAEWQILHQRVVAAGGLHVIGTERHEAIRIDRQLLGRSGRQGDPGSGQFFLSLEDQILEAVGTNKQLALQELGRKGGVDAWDQYAGLFVIAQKRTERKHYRQRLDLLHYERQRKELLADIGADPFVD